MARRPAGKPDLKNLDPKILGRVFGYVFEDYKFHCILVLVTIVVSALCSVSSSLFLRSLIDDYITPLLNSPVKDFGPLTRAILTMVMIFAVGVVANVLNQFTLMKISQGTMNKIRDEIFTHMERLPISYFDTHAHGDIMSVYTNDTDTLRQVISQSVPQTISSCITIVSVLTSMFVLSVPLTLVSLCMVGVMYYFLSKIGGQSGKYFFAQQNHLGKVNGYIEEMMEGVKVVKVFTYEKRATEKFKELNDELCESSYNAHRYANILMPVLANLGNISYVLVAFFGGSFALNGWMGTTLGTVAGFLNLNKSFTNPITQVSQQLNSVIMAMAGCKRIFAVIDEQPEVDQGVVTMVNVTQEEDGSLVECEKVTGKWAWKHPHTDGSVSLVPQTGDVRFEHVDFSYNPEKQILHDIQVYAEPGQKVAFVGATGAGKTTIMNLINRFYDIQEGQILYDGIDVKLIKKDDLRHSLGIVLQDTHLFTGTIRENISYAQPNATEEEVIAAAKLANAHSFIKHLEHGYDTMLTNDGASLSQGQRQLLSIARAALANPPVLILDEATSSIDSRTEKIVQDGMDRLMKGRTVFVIAHRLSTIKNSDVIMVMDQGRIVERGNHDSLLAKKGIYYRLYTGALEID